MKKLIYTTVALFAVAMFFTACDETRDGARGSITGVVMDRTTGESIPVANVRLLPGESSLFTGTDGFFQFENLESGTYTLFVSADGYRDETISGVVVSQNIVRRDVALERLPAIVTVDRTTLDFGAEEGVTELSFSLVNRSREDLEWSITTATPWIVNITPNSGTIEHGITRAVQITIDRRLLEVGNNTTVLVVMSDNGRSEITITAYRQDTRMRVATTLGQTTTTSATIFNRVFTPEGSRFDNEAPTAIWIYFSTNPNPTNEGTRINLTIPTSARSHFAIYTTTEIPGLTPVTTYYVQVFATNSRGTESGEIVTFTTRDLYFTHGQLAVQWVDVSTSAYGPVASRLCSESDVGGHSDWRLPSLGELGTMFTLRYEIGGFANTNYWGSFSHQIPTTTGGDIDIFHFHMNFGNGSSGTSRSHRLRPTSGNTINRTFNRVRCVRTIEP